MTSDRIGLRAPLACVFFGVWGCNTTFQLYVGNDTTRPFALRINNFDHAYALDPSAKIQVPDRLQRNTAYTLVARDRKGREYEHRIYADSPRLFVHLREDRSDTLEWIVSTTPPEP